MKIKNIKNSKNEEGSSLLIILLLLSVLLFLGTSLSMTSLFQYKTSIREERKLQAQYIAKTGANMVAGAIQNEIINPSDLNNKESSPINLNNGSFIVNVLDNGSSITIISTGTVSNITESITLVLSRITGENMFPLLDHAIFADGFLEFEGSPQVNGNLGVNENGLDENGNPTTAVKLGGDPDINGDIFIGPGGTADAVVTPGDWWSFDGIVDNLPEERSYPLPEYPVFPDDLNYTSGTYLAGWYPEPPYTINSSMWYDKIEVKSELIINIYDDDIILRAGDFHVTDSGKITVNRYGNGKLKLYVSDDFQLTGSSTINNAGSPEDTYMYYSGEEIIVDGTTKFVGSAYIEKADMEIMGSGGITGHITSGGNYVTISGDASANVRAIYAPKADILFNGSGHAKGAVIGKTITMTGGTYVDYDDSMQDMDFAELGFEVTEGYSRTWK